MDRTISVIYGKNIHDMTLRLLSSCDLQLPASGANASAVIKPNLVTPSGSDTGATTHTEIVEAIIIHLISLGFRNITVAEGSWVGASTESAFRALGYYDLRDRYGIHLVDTKKDEYRSLAPFGIPMEVSRTVLDADLLINVPVLKGHCQTLMTNAMKNLKGCLSDRSKREFHRLGLDLPIAALNSVIHPDLTIVDSICGDLDFEEGGNPVQTDRMLASAYPVLLDAYSATLMGYRPEDIGYIRKAQEIGLIEDFRWEVKELSKPVVSNARAGGEAKRLSVHTSPIDACSACYAALIHALKRLEDENGLGRLKGRTIAIGQGYSDKAPEIGVGACCRKAGTGVAGCPASADSILQMLRGL